MDSSALSLEHPGLFLALRRGIPLALAAALLATALLHGIGLMLGRVLRERSVWLPRVVGLASAAFGLSLMLG